MQKQKMTVLKMAAMAVCLTATTLAASAQTITKAVTSRGFANNTPSGVTSVFKPNNHTIHSYVEFAKPFKCSLKSVWYAVKAKGLNANQKLQELNLKENSYASGHFQLTNNSNWPAGTYRIDIYANNKKIRALKFSVK